MKKLSLKKVTVASLNRKELIDVKGGATTNAWTSPKICKDGTLQEGCSNAVDCTAGVYCNPGTHPV